MCVEQGSFVFLNHTPVHTKIKGEASLPTSASGLWWHLCVIPGHLNSDLSPSLDADPLLMPITGIWNSLVITLKGKLQFMHHLQTAAVRKVNLDSNFNVCVNEESLSNGLSLRYSWVCPFLHVSCEKRSWVEQTVTLHSNQHLYVVIHREVTFPRLVTTLQANKHRIPAGTEDRSCLDSHSCPLQRNKMKVVWSVGDGRWRQRGGMAEETE